MHRRQFTYTPTHCFSPGCRALTLLTTYSVPGWVFQLLLVPGPTFPGLDALTQTGQSLNCSVVLDSNSSGLNKLIQATIPNQLLHGEEQGPQHPMTSNHIGINQNTLGTALPGPLANLSHLQAASVGVSNRGQHPSSALQPSRCVLGEAADKGRAISEPVYVPKKWHRGKVSTHMFKKKKTPNPKKAPRQTWALLCAEGLFCQKVSAHGQLMCKQITSRLMKKQPSIPGQILGTGSIPGVSPKARSTHTAGVATS